MRLVNQTVLVLSILILSLLAGCRVIEDGTTGISKRFGIIRKETLSPGVYVQVPLFREIEVWNVKTQRKAISIETPSAEGLMVNLEATVLFKPEDVVGLRTTIGVDWINKVLTPATKKVFRSIIGKERVDDIIRNQGRLISDAKSRLTSEMAPRGIKIEEVLVTDLSLPEKFRRAVELKLESEQRALQKEFELKQAKKDAEIEIARAEGAAKAQEIVQRTLSPNYLQYLWISTLNKNPNVIYVATEANMPVFRTTTTNK